MDLRPLVGRASERERLIALLDLAAAGRSETEIRAALAGRYDSEPVA